MFTSKLAVFDLDGTLNQTHLYSVKAGYKAIEAMGLCPANYTDAMFIACLGKRGEDYTRELIPNIDDEGIQKYLAFEMEYEKECIAEGADCFPGVRESLKTLRDAGWAIGVCSNSKLPYINMVLDALGIQELIDYRQELINGLTKKETLQLLLNRTAPQKAVMVGDRIYDKEAAEFNNIPFVGCLYGYTPDEVRDEFAAESGFELASRIHNL